VDQVRAIRLDVNPRHGDEQRTALPFVQHVGQNVGVGQPLADRAGGGRPAATSLHTLHLAPRDSATFTSGQNSSRIAPATSGARGRLIYEATGCPTAHSLQIGP
jgi:hypothetical protein